MEREMPKIVCLGDACCGCGACAAKCPKGCIEMRPDGCGFLHPAVDEESCVGCGACDTVCPAMAERREDGHEGVIWARSKDVDERLNSSSGGVFALLAHDALDVGGIVCGAVWDEGCRHVRHVLVDSDGGLDSVMRSKYVQSSVGCDVYEGVREALRSGRRVLFTGTACQVAGMRAYLGKLADSDGFLSVDVICHGVPSPLLWERWVEYRESRASAPLRGVNMRSKTTGWLSYSAMYEYMAEKDGALVRDGSVFGDDWFMRAFLSNASLRSSCFACPVKRSCGSDVTLGDFWGIQSAHPEVDYEGGVSAVLANTAKGLSAVESLKPRLEWGESSVEKVLPGNSSLLRSVSPYEGRDEFLHDLEAGICIGDFKAKYEFKAKVTLARRVRGLLSRAKRRLLKGRR